MRTHLLGSGVIIPQQQHSDMTARQGLVDKLLLFCLRAQTRRHSAPPHQAMRSRDAIPTSTDPVSLGERLRAVVKVTDVHAAPRLSTLGRRAL